MTALGGKRAYGDRLGKDRSLRHSCHSIARARLHPIATLAHMTKRGQFHFSRVFHRSVGVSPYRYIVYLRLRSAVELIREGRLELAEIAAITGFADQSHLSRWVRRVHGVSPTQLVS